MPTEDLINALRGIQWIVINNCYGGFSISDDAEVVYREMAGITDPNWYSRYIDRDDPYLVKIVKEMGAAANGSCANLKIIEIPGDVDWQIEEYDGKEWVAERHRTWS